MLVGIGGLRRAREPPGDELLDGVAAAACDQRPRMLPSVRTDHDAPHGLSSSRSRRARMCASRPCAQSIRRLRHVKEPDNGPRRAMFAQRTTVRARVRGVTDTASALPEGASERLELGSGSIHVLRGGEGPPLLFLHAAGGAGAWHPLPRAPGPPLRRDRARPSRLRRVRRPARGRGRWTTSSTTTSTSSTRSGSSACTSSAASLGGWLAAELAVHSPAARRAARAARRRPGCGCPEHPVTDIFLMTPDAGASTTLFHDPRGRGRDVPGRARRRLHPRGLPRHDRRSARYALAPVPEQPEARAPPAPDHAPDARRSGPTTTASSRSSTAERYAERIPDARARRSSRTAATPCTSSGPRRSPTPSRPFLAQRIGGAERPVKFNFFHLMPYPYLPDDFDERYDIAVADVPEQALRPQARPRALPPLPRRARVRRAARLRRHLRSTSTTRPPTG